MISVRLVTDWRTVAVEPVESLGAPTWHRKDRRPTMAKRNAKNQIKPQVIDVKFTIEATAARIVRADQSAGDIHPAE